MAIVVGLLFVSPLAIRALAATAERLPIAVRLALRDLARYRARSGAALAAISLGLGIAAATVVIAAAAQHSAGEGNLSDRQVLVRLGNDQEPVIPAHSPAELQQFQSDVDRFAATLNGATVIALDAAVNPRAHETRQGQSFMAEAMLGRRINENSFRDAGILYVATPELLDHLGLDPSLLNSQADVLTSHTGELSLMGPIKHGRCHPRHPPPAEDLGSELLVCSDLAHHRRPVSNGPACNRRAPAGSSRRPSPSRTRS